MPYQITTVSHTAEMQFDSNGNLAPGAVYLADLSAAGLSFVQPTSITNNNDGTTTTIRHFDEFVLALAWEKVIQARTATISTKLVVIH